MDSIELPPDVDSDQADATEQDDDSDYEGMPPLEGCSDSDVELPPAVSDSGSELFADAKTFGHCACNRCSGKISAATIENARLHHSECVTSERLQLVWNQIMKMTAAAGPKANMEYRLGDTPICRTLWTGHAAVDKYRNLQSEGHCKPPERQKVKLPGSANQTANAGAWFLQLYMSLAQTQPRW